MAAVALQPRTASRGTQEAPRSTSDITGRLARYMVSARSSELPSEVLLAAKHRILDTIGAVVSGTQLKPGEMAIRYVRAQGGTPEASIPATDIRTSAINAAFACGMFAHADETDDFEPVTKAHPGCVVVPAALSMGEREDRSRLRDTAPANVVRDQARLARRDPDELGHGLSVERVHQGEPETQREAQP